MACTAARLTLLRHSKVRSYATATSLHHSAANAPAAEMQTVGSNKIPVATVDSDHPVAKICIAFRAGSRNETYDTQGIAHHMRIAAGLSSTRSTTFAITRNIQQLGGEITATTDREIICYTLNMLRENVMNGLSFFEDAVVHQAFKPWEVSDQIPRMRNELSSIPTVTRVSELLHKVAYRSGLGYSLYCPKWQLGHITSETLQHFTNSWLTASRCAISAIGMPMSELSQFASNLSIPQCGSSDEPSKYHGGEVRKDRKTDMAAVAIAVESSGLNNEKQALAYAVMQAAAGTGPRVKWGQNCTPLYKALTSAAGQEPYLASAFNVCYSDTGLFGIMLTTTPSTAGRLTEAAHKWLRSPNLTDADIAKGKAQLKADILYGSDCTSGILDCLTHSLLMKNKISTPLSIVDDIEKVSASDVKSVAAKCATGKLSMAAIGNLGTVPYITQLS